MYDIICFSEKSTDSYKKYITVLSRNILVKLTRLVCDILVRVGCGLWAGCLMVTIMARVSSDSPRRFSREFKLFLKYRMSSLILQRHLLAAPTKRLYCMNLAASNNVESLARLHIKPAT